MDHVVIDYQSIEDEIIVIGRTHFGSFSCEIEISEGLRVYGYFSVGPCASHGGI